ncbi:hypothetical protein UFOVP649_78 [uncultured Caudovirales phage]|jgi:hypothetical protein|uniref:Uncharacterized protein n=1 Tax=uncultured Caudovirales phage TaxID=2100421 RepID=A0A6J5NDA8_9CAUD|nr:hypothetical protein UFOVP649_78 [uncultured Caudovirales phage]
MITPEDPCLVVAKVEEGWCLAWRSKNGSIQQASNAWPSREQAEDFQTMARPYLGATAFCAV